MVFVDVLDRALHVGVAFVALRMRAMVVALASEWEMVDIGGGGKRGIH